MTGARCARIQAIEFEVDALRNTLLQIRDDEEKGRAVENCCVSEVALDHLTHASQGLMIVADQLSRARTCR